MKFKTYLFGGINDRDSRGDIMCNDGFNATSSKVVVRSKCGGGNGGDADEMVYRDCCGEVRMVAVMGIVRLWWWW